MKRFPNRSITKAAGIGETWTPRELRHSFVSIMSDNGVTVEDIADMARWRVAEPDEQGGA